MPPRSLTPSKRYHAPPLLLLQSKCLAASSPYRFFNTSRILLNDSSSSKSHYERLNLRTDATPAEIKKSFYTLSKKHHPDANPNDPTAAHTFSALSESYTILSDPPRRAAYDRDVLRLQHHHHHHSPKASYHSTNPAGGRPASGLSSRRGTFRGPPPSFYRSGGWGAHTEKRKKAHEESTAGAESSSSQARYENKHPHHSHQQHHSRANPWAAGAGGMGPGSGDPFSWRNDDQDIPHFDKKATERTQQREDQRRWERSKRAMGDDGEEFEPQMSLGAHFLVVLGILATSFIVPVAYLRFMRTERRRKEDY